MQQLTPEGRQKVTELVQRFGVSVDAVMTLLYALVDGNGSMAQFEHKELGGRGQWMRGGMVMVGDMFNNALKATIDGLCLELSQLLASHPLQSAPVHSQAQSQGAQLQQQGEARSAGSSHASSPVSLFVSPPVKSGMAWWPADLGTPTTSGAQNSLRYAYFPEKRRLAVAVNGDIIIYDTLDHQISGVSQQQGAGSSLTFTSQHGVVLVNILPVVSGSRLEKSAAVSPTSASHASTSSAVASATSAQVTDIIATLERLAELKQKGILSEEEFAAKKAELLSRI